MTKQPQRAQYGAAAYANLRGKLPNVFPRVMGPNCAKYLREVVASGLTSDMVERFEAAFARAHGVKHCIATPGCTPALAVLAAAFGFEPGDEIIVSSVTDYGTIMGLLVENYIPVFADTAPGTLTVSAETIERCITSRSRAILVVHKTGLICDMDPILALAEKHGLIVYEDVCQAVLGKYKGRLAGTMGLAAGYSFDSEKTLGSDSGGCIITNDDAVAEKCRFIGHSRGATLKPGFGRIHTARGYAYRMPQCTAAVTLAQFEIAPDAVARRDRMARMLAQRIGRIPGIKPLPIPEYVTVYSAWMVGFSIEPRAFRCDATAFAAQLADAGIPGAGHGRYYLMPEALVFLQKKAADKIYPYSRPPASRDYRYGAQTCPVAHAFLENFIRWCTFCEKYEEAHVNLAAEIISHVAEGNRK